MAIDDNTSTEEKEQLDNAAALPMRKDLKDEDIEADPQQRDIHKTFGGKILHFFTFYVIGFALNSALSLGITYKLNPLPRVKTTKEQIATGISKLLGGAENKKVTDSVRSGIEMAFMLIAGTIVTGIMTPLVKYRGILAYKINQIFKKDMDVLPHELQKPPEPKTVEEKIEQEIHKRVKKHSTSDIWSPRIILTAVIFLGDFLVNRANRLLESKKIPSVDTLSWNLGQQIYKIMPEKWVKGWSNWFSKNGSSVGDIQKNMGDHFDRLKTHGEVNRDPNSMVIAEQTRLVVKELGWTFLMAKFMETLTGKMRDHRIHKQEEKAIAEITREGIVPEGYKIAFDEKGHVTLDKQEAAQKTERWAGDKKASEDPRFQKSVNHTGALENRMGDGQVALN